MIFIQQHKPYFQYPVFYGETKHVVLEPWRQVAATMRTALPDGEGADRIAELLRRQVRLGFRVMRSSQSGGLPNVVLTQL